MYSEKFLKFIEMWQKDFAIEKSIDEKICADRDGNPIPWYTYPAIEYLSQFDYSDKKIFERGARCRAWLRYKRRPYALYACVVRCCCQRV